MKARSHLRLALSDASSFGFEILEEKTIVTCATPRDEISNRFRPDPTQYGESITIQRVSPKLLEEIRKDLESYESVDALRSKATK